MKHGKGTLTTVYDSVNFYRDVYDDPNVTFKREGDKITLISGDGTIINDKLIAKSEDAFNHKFDTYTPLEKQLNENQQIVFEWAKNYLISIKDIAWFIDELAFLPTTGGKMRYKEVAHIYESLSNTEKLSLLNVIIEWALEQEEE